MVYGELARARGMNSARSMRRRFIHLRYLDIENNSASILWSFTELAGNR